MVAHVGGRAEPEHGAIGDLARELEHGGPEPGEIDRRRRGQARNAALPGDAIARARMLDAAPETLAERGDVLAHHLQGAPHVQTERALHHRAMTHADAEPQPTSRHLLERQRLLRHEHGVPRVNGNHARAQPHPGRHARVGREDEKGDGRRGEREPHGWAS